VNYQQSGGIQQMTGQTRPNWKHNPNDSKGSKAPWKKAPQKKAPQKKVPQQKAPQKKAPQQKAPPKKAPPHDTENYGVLNRGPLDYTILACQERETSELISRLLPKAKMVSVFKHK